MPTHPLTPLAAAVLHVSPAPERVLEVGCGEGDAALFLAREFPAARVRGVDRSEERVRAATARVGLDPEGRIAFKAGSPHSLPYPDDFFDLVVQSTAHPSPKELARVLRPNAHLILLHPGPTGRKRPDIGRLRPVGGLVGWVWRQRLARRGFELVEGAEVEGGSFSVARLRGGDSPGCGD